jgi:acyl-CoA synthetase (AMP-forming)/AMP-acid ligase II
MQHPKAFARTHPDRPAVIMGGSGRVTTYRALDERSNRLAHTLRAAGLRTGDHLAVVMDNRPEIYEVMWAGFRSGLHVTPINWHLAPDEVQYVIDDCGAAALVVSTAAADAVAAIGAGEGRRTKAHLRLAVADGSGRAIEGFADYEAALAAQPPTPVDDECEGQWMLYSSGTTGKPKGIKPAAIGGELGAPNSFSLLVQGLYGAGEDTVYLSPAPLYHAAPAGWSTTMHRLGATVVVMERFDAEQCLALIERHRVTHAQFVPTHLIRMLQLPAEVRAKYDVSSLRYAVHAAAPCPVDVKRAVIDWWGPVVYEYYSGSEGVGFCAIDSQQWLAHPGSVGKPITGAAHILDEDGKELATGESGQIWFETMNRFEYHGDQEKTAGAYNDRGWASLGDVGYLDEDGYLYLNDRVSNMIISGGVNIYPAEIEAVLFQHPAVRDCIVIGVPDTEMGESVRAVVEPAAPVDDDDAFSAELQAFCRERIARFKCPTSVVLMEQLPRLPTGKLSKRMLPDSVRVR